MKGITCWEFESSHDKKAKWKIQLVSRYPLKDRHENAQSGKEITWPIHSLQAPSLFLKWRNKEKKRKRNPKIPTELTKFCIANKHRTATLRKMKLKRPSLGQFNQKKWKKKKRKQRMTFIKSPTRLVKL